MMTCLATLTLRPKQPKVSLEHSTRFPSLRGRAGSQMAEKQGGVAGIAKVNQEKADLLYNTLAETKNFESKVDENSRSIMNVPFVTGNPDLDAEFVKEAEAHHLLNLKGHRLVGGMRASIYNAMPLEGVQALCDFIKDFDAKH